MDREEIMLKRVMLGLVVFMVGIGFGYWWHFMAVN